MKFSIAAGRSVSIEELEGRIFLTGAPYVIDGIQPAALDQPQVHVLLRQTPGGPPLVATDPDSGATSFDIQAFLDTGTSGILLSNETYTALGLNPISYGSPAEDVLYSDVGIGGQTVYNVSDPLYTGIAPFSPNVDGTDESTFNQAAGPFRVELNPTPVNGDPNDPFNTNDPVDIVGMPAMQGKVMVMDPKPVNDLSGNMNTYLYDPGTPFNQGTADTDPGIPQTSFDVQLNYSDFSRFTSIDPEGAPGPTLSDNPMIGPNPLSQIDPSIPPGDSPPITIEQNFGAGQDYSTTGTFLFDSGAAASFISQDMASRVHVHYEAGHGIGSDAPILVDDQGNQIPDQFVLPLSGADGNPINVAGLYLSSLTLQTKQGTPIEFTNAPVMVLDVELQDSVTSQTITLDGDFGMNFLVASLALDNTGPLSGSSVSPWDWINFDQPDGLLSFAPSTGDVGGGAIGIEDAHLFYNNSAWDNYTPGFNATADAQAIAPDKQPLSPGGTATFANYSTDVAGINGVMVDTLNIPNPLTLNDFSFLVGNSDDPSTWTPAPLPQMIEYPGGGDASNTDRYEFIWPDGAIKGEWLQISLLATTNSTMPADETIYFGNAPGETGNDSTNAIVDGTDFAATRDHQNNFLNPAAINNPYDFNRDKLVDGTDLAIVRDNNTNFLNALQLISPPDPNGSGLDAAAPDHAVTESVKTRAPLPGKPPRVMTSFPIYSSQKTANVAPKPVQPSSGSSTPASDGTHTSGAPPIIATPPAPPPPPVSVATTSPTVALPTDQTPTASDNTGTEDTSSRSTAAQVVDHAAAKKPKAHAHGKPTAHQAAHAHVAKPVFSSKPIKHPHHAMASAHAALITKVPKLHAHASKPKS